MESVPITVGRGRHIESVPRFDIACAAVIVAPIFLIFVLSYL